MLFQDVMHDVFVVHVAMQNVYLLRQLSDMKPLNPWQSACNNKYSSATSLPWVMSCIGPYAQQTCCGQLYAAVQGGLLH